MRHPPSLIVVKGSNGLAIPEHIRKLDRWYNDTVLPLLEDQLAGFDMSELEVLPKKGNKLLWLDAIRDLPGKEKIMFDTLMWRWTPEEWDFRFPGPVVYFRRRFKNMTEEEWCSKKTRFAFNKNVLAHIKEFIERKPNGKFRVGYAPEQPWLQDQLHKFLPFFIHAELPVGEEFYRGMRLPYHSKKDPLADYLRIDDRYLATEEEEEEEQRLEREDQQQPPQQPQPRKMVVRRKKEETDVDSGDPDGSTGTNTTTELLAHVYVNGKNERLVRIDDQEVVRQIQVSGRSDWTRAQIEDPGKLIRVFWTDTSTTTAVKISTVELLEDDTTGGPASRTRRSRRRGSTNTTGTNTTSVGGAASSVDRRTSVASRSHENIAVGGSGGVAGRRKAGGSRSNGGKPPPVANRPRKPTIVPIKITENPEARDILASDEKMYGKAIAVLQQWQAFPFQTRNTIKQCFRRFQRDVDASVLDPGAREQICNEAKETICSCILKSSSRLVDRRFGHCVQRFLDSVRDDIRDMIIDTLTFEDGCDGLDSNRDLTVNQVATALRFFPELVSTVEATSKQYSRQFGDDWKRHLELLQRPPLITGPLITSNTGTSSCPPAHEEQERAAKAAERATSLLREFTDKEQAIIDEAIWGEGPSTRIVASIVTEVGGTDTVQRSSMDTLQPGEKLKEEIMHYFFVMLAKRDEKLCRDTPRKKRSHFFKSFFITDLLNEGNKTNDGEYEYQKVKRWSKKVPGKDIFALDKIFFLINIGNRHWCCAVIFMQKKRIEMFDSMGSDGQYYMDVLFRYLKDEHRVKKKIPLPDIEEWELVPTKRETPQQRNDYDCGVFVCFFADFLSMDLPLTFDQSHINSIRELVALSIMKRKVIV